MADEGRGLEHHSDYRVSEVAKLAMCDINNRRHDWLKWYWIDRKAGAVRQRHCRRCGKRERKKS